MADAFDNTLVGLMQQEPINVVTGQMIVVQHILDVFGRLGDSGFVSVLYIVGTEFAIDVIMPLSIKPAIVTLSN